MSPPDPALMPVFALQNEKGPQLRLGAFFASCQFKESARTQPDHIEMRIAIPTSGYLRLYM